MITTPIKHEHILDTLAGFGFRECRPSYPLCEEPILKAFLQTYQPQGELEKKAVKLTQQYVDDPPAFRTDPLLHRQLREVMKDMYLDAGFKLEDLRDYFCELNPK